MPVFRIVPQGLVLGLILFNICILYLDEGIVATLSRFADYTKLGRMADTVEGCAAIQRDQDRLESWAERNQVRFNKCKYRVLHLGRNNHVHQYRLGDDLLEGSYAEREQGVLVENRLAMSPSVAWWPRRPLASLHVLKKSVAGRSREVILPSLLCPGQVSPRVLCPVLVSLVQKRQGSPGKSPVEGHEDDKGSGASLL